MSERRERLAMEVQLWDAINAVVTASGGAASNTSVARQKAAVLVNQTVDAIAAHRAEKAERERDEALVAEHHMNVERDDAIMDGLRYKRQRDEAMRERDEARREAERLRAYAQAGCLPGQLGQHQLPWEREEGEGRAARASCTARDDE